MSILSVLRKEPSDRETRGDRRERTRWDNSASLWRDTSRRLWFAPPATDIDCDVAVVGAGFTGLWTALHLKQAGPATDVVVLEALQPGFGGSGRNGGWCSAQFPVPDAALESRFGRNAARALRDSLEHTVDMIGDFVGARGINCGWTKSGTLNVAVNGPQWDRLREDAHSADGTTVLDADELAGRVHVAGALGASHDPRCAALDPHALLDGLLDACVAAGVRIHGGTRVESVHREHLEARTDAGLVFVTARRTVVATEAYTALLPGQRRRVVPVYSSVIATDPLAPAVWGSIGWSGRETLSIAGHTVTYAQRTADGRIVLGGRGSPYGFASEIHSARDSHGRTHDNLERLLRTLFPQTEGTRISHRWGGPVGIARDRMPTVWTDEGNGAVHAAGYAGDGVALSHLAARVITSLVLDTDDPARALPLHGRRPPAWAPEPLRWVGLNAGIRLAGWADAREARTGRRSRAAERLLAVR